MGIDLGALTASVEISDKMSDGLDKIGKAFLPLTAAIVGFGAASIKLATDFESSFAGVKKTIEATPKEIAALSTELRKLSKEVPVNVNELNQVAEAAGQLGIKKKDIVQFTATMAALGTATNLTAEEAAIATAQIQNIFAAAGKDVDRFGATLVALGNDGASTEKQIIEMAQRIAGAGNQVGMAQHEVLAIASALSSVGIEAEMGGSAISKLMINMAAAVSAGGKDLQQFADAAHMSSEQFTTAFKTNAAGAIAAFMQGLNETKKSGGDVLAVLASMGIAEVRLRDTILRAAGAGDLMTNALKLGAKAWQENKALTKEAEQRYATFASQAIMLANKIRDLGITVGLALLPKLKEGVEVISSWIPVVERLIGWVLQLPTPVLQVGVAVAALVAAIGPLLIGLGMLISVIGSLSTAVISIHAGFTALAASTLIPSIVTGLTAMTSAVAATTIAMAPMLLMIGKIALAFAAGWAIGALIRDLTGLGGWLDKVAVSMTNFDKVMAEAHQNNLKILAAKKKSAEVDAEIARVQAEINKLTDAGKTKTTALALSLDQQVSAAMRAAQADKDMKEASELMGREITNAAEAAKILSTQHGILEGRAKAAKDKLDAMYQTLQKNAMKGREMVTPLLGLPELADDIERTYSAAGEVVGKEMEEGFEKARAAANKFFEENKLGAAFSNSIKALPDTILDALKGGGNVMKTVGAKLGGDLAKGLIVTLNGPGGDGITNAISGLFGKDSAKLSGKLGTFFSGAITTALPVIGTALGSGLSKIFGGLFGGGEGKEMRKMRDEFIAMEGGMERLQAKAARAGISLSAMFDATSVKGMGAAIQGIMDVFDHQAFRFEKVNDIATKYNLTISEMSPRFQAQRMHEQMMPLFEDWEGLMFVTNNAGLSIEKLGPKLGEFVNQAIAGGIALPEAFRPMIDAFIKSGGLIDENGVAFGSAEEAGITFTETVEESIRSLIDAIKEMVATLNGVRPNPVVVPVQFQYQGPPPPPGYGGPANGMIPGFATGSDGIQNFGSGTLAMLHDMEAVITEQQWDAMLGAMGKTSASVASDVVSAPRSASSSMRSREFPDNSDAQGIMERVVGKQGGKMVLMVGSKVFGECVTESAFNGYVQIPDSQVQRR